MERKGGCCLAPRYGGGAAAGQQAGAAWQMGRIMLKFRPIAPKPAAMAPAAPVAPTPAVAAVGGAGRGGKRKAAAVCGGGGGGGRRGRKPKKAVTAAVVTAPAPAAAAAAAVKGDVADRKMECCGKEKPSPSPSRSSSSSGMTSVDSSPPQQPRPQQLHHQLVTLLPLMPVTPAVEASAGAAAEEPAPAPVPPSQSQVAAPAAAGPPRPFAPLAMRPAAAAASSLVTVEEVTATWRDGEAAPPSSAAAACAVGSEAPAFVSDQWGRVTWTNAAFGRAVSFPDVDGGEAAAAAAAAPGVVLGVAVPTWGTCAGFTCRVRVRRGGSSVVAPCDVWRLDAGGSYLWRLDLQAALTLGGRL